MAVVTTLPFGQPLTRADLEAMPDDGHRYELLDGSLVVTPAPSRSHQVALLKLAMLLASECPSHLQVLVAPFDVTLAPDTVLQPDLVVADRSELTEHDLPAAPALAVEILSPSTRRIDLTLKRSRLEAAGCPAYWVVDPVEPSLTVWELVEGRYVDRAHVVGTETAVLARPFPVEVTPSELRDPDGPVRPG
jgi:Uma2 family endonuclease